MNGINGYLTEYLTIFTVASFIIEHRHHEGINEDTINYLQNSRICLNHQYSCFLSSKEQYGIFSLLLRAFAIQNCIDYYFIMSLLG